MRRKLFFLAYVLFDLAAGNCLAQQYSFIQYTPRDGLVSNRVRSISQDTKGKIYFCTLGGLSMYDGARFTNYTAQNGLCNEVVNCLIEMGPDSFWVATNTNRLNYLSHGMVGTLALEDSLAPTVNYFCRSAKGDLFAACDDGLFRVEKGHFSKLNLLNMQGQDINSYLSLIFPFTNYLLVLRDFGLVSKDQQLLYLYDWRMNKIVAEVNSCKVFHFAASKDGRIWLATSKGIRQLNIQALEQGKFVIESPAPRFTNFTRTAGYFYFDRFDNCWLSDGLNVVKKCDPQGNVISYSSESGINIMPVSVIFQDVEGNMWLAGNGNGVQKLVHPNFSIMSAPWGFNLSASMICASPNGECFIYSASKGKLLQISGTDRTAFHLSRKNIFQVAITGKNMYGINGGSIFKLNKQGRILKPSTIFADTANHGFGHTLVDKYDNLIITGREFITAVVGKTVSQVEIPNYSDQLSLDSKGYIWAATRGDSLFQLSPHPERPGAYLQLEALFPDILKGLSPRSIAIDKFDRIWIGTRYKGIYIFQFQNKTLHLRYQLDVSNGLTENFICWLSCDSNNNVWASSPSGLDRIQIENENFSIENCTRENNLYRHVYYSLTDKDNTTWAMSNSGLIKITPRNEPASEYVPTLMLTQLHIGNVLMTEHKHSFRYDQNNLSFYFAATSFLDEKRIEYSYQLLGSSNPKWSEASNTPFVSFIDLRPGKYDLKIKATFPAARYPEQIFQYSFIIHPPWWQTWWFVALLTVIAYGALLVIVKTYYKRKLHLHKMLLEKKQAIEKERTRIATDMHDDLGAGLSRIKFLSETIGMKKQQHQPIDEDIDKIRNYSHEMITKMGEIVWALNERNDSLSDLLAYIRAYAVEYLEQAGIHCTMQMQDRIEPKFISGEFRRNIFLSVKEILNNIVKHAQADAVTFSIEADKNLVITISDNGIGFNKARLRPFSNGIGNIEKRIQDLRGSCVMETTNGTRVQLCVPL